MKEYFRYSTSRLSSTLKNHVFGVQTAEPKESSSRGTKINVFEASHPHWSGHLHLCHETGLLVFAEVGSLAAFRMAGERLIVDRFEYPTEEFQLVNKRYVHVKLLSG
jgi:hypothetical protein